MKLVDETSTRSAKARADKRRMTFIMSNVTDLSDFGLILYRFYVTELQGNELINGQIEHMSGVAPSLQATFGLFPKGCVCLTNATF